MRMSGVVGVKPKVWYIKIREDEQGFRLWAQRGRKVSYEIDTREKIEIARWLLDLALQETGEGA